MTTLYGIHNCDTVKKTQKWLTSNNFELSLFMTLEKMVFQNHY